MRIRRCGGMTEFIPSPAEKRDGVIRNHVLELLANLDARIQQLEQFAGISSGPAEQFSEMMKRIALEESHIQQVNEELLREAMDQPNG